MRDAKYENGFTLVELIVALMVTAIILAATASLAYALGVANDATGEASKEQARLRYATVRLSELIKHGRLICGLPADDIAVWRADGNVDGQINPGELVYIVAGPGRGYIKLLQFIPPVPLENTVISISDIQAGTAKDQLVESCNETYAALIPECSNVAFDVDDQPPWSRLVNMSFDITENGVERHFQISAGVRSWAGHLLTAAGDMVNGDDD